ncbi:iron-containing alcohol dehydrogenase [Roseovarius salis]|uniref:iron-containing alcohol dehydrogenase n=1 Tax=Roseovarius salis TaxID=3376063 RepID=UPI0037CBAF50
MEHFDFATARRVLFGRGRFAEAPALAASLGRNVLVIHGASARHVGSFLAGAETLALTVSCHACPAEPDLAILSDALEAARAADADVVVAIGGGAAMDLAKAAAGLMPARRDPLDHLEVVGRGLPLEHAPLPCLAVPTTAGTGAEVTRNAVIGVPQHERKVSLRDPRLVPDIALVDPALTDNAPRDVTLGSGLDAITQVIEPYLSSRATPLTDAICRAAIARGLGALARLTEDEDTSARDEMAFVSLSGGIALSNAGLGAVHGLAGVIGGMVPGAPHGAVCGALLPHVLAANRAAAGGAAIGRFDEVEQAIEQALGTPDLAGWAAAKGLPGLDRMGVAAELYPAVVEWSQSSSSMKANPVELTNEVLLNVLRAAA